MFCCFEAPSPHYSAVQQAEDKPRPRDHDWKCYPGCLRTSMLPHAASDEEVFVKTGGNALQAIDRAAFESENVISVTVPSCCKPGQSILVTLPDGTGRCISAEIPDGAFPGHVFLVQVPPPVVVTGVPVNGPQLASHMGDEGNDLLLMEETREIEMASHSQTQQQPAANNNNTEQQHGRVLIKVPPGVVPGSKIRVQIPDGRTIDVVVPPGETSQFYVQVPRRQQNWHDSPLAYAAPMGVAPLLL